MNPGPPAPQAGVIIRTRRQAPETRLYDKTQVLNVLAKLKASGIGEGTLRTLEYQLKILSEKTNLNNPEDVKNYVANRKDKNGNPIANSYKNNLIKAYSYYASINNIYWNRPYFAYERKIPRIPTTLAIDKIISASSFKFGTIFKVLAETGAEGKELETVAKENIDQEQGIIYFQGCKFHNLESNQTKSTNCRTSKKIFVQIH